jgi:hypothetical protein
MAGQRSGTPTAARGGELGKKIGWERNEKRHELRRAGTLTWVLIPCHEYATCIPEGPKAIIYSTCTGVKYAGNTLTIRETTKYKYSSNNFDGGGCLFFSRMC